MFRELSTAVMSAAAFFAVAGPANAADVYTPADAYSAPVASAQTRVNWTGVYVGGQFGWGNANHDVTATGDVPYEVDASECTVSVLGGRSITRVSVDGLSADDCKKIGGRFEPRQIGYQTAKAFIDGLNSQGILGGGSLGGDIQFGRLVFGVRGDYNLSELETKAGLSIGAESGELSVKEGDSWNAIFRLGFAVGADSATLLYGLGGYGQVDYDYKLSGSDPIEVTYDSWIGGVGVEHAIFRNVTVGLEWQHWFGEKKTVYEDESLKVTDDLSRDIIMGRVNLRSSMKSPLE